MKDRVVAIGTLMLSVVFFAVACLGDDDAQKEDGGFSDVSDRGEVIAEMLTDGGYGDHSMRQAVVDCAFIDEADLHILLMDRIHSEIESYRGPLNSEELDEVYEAILGGVFDVELEDVDDEFERRERLDEIQELYQERSAQLRGRPLCVEFDLYLDEYDFDQQTLQVGENGAVQIYRNHIDGVVADFGVDDDYLPPLPLLLQWPQGALTMSPDRAEQFLGTLERLEDEESEDDLQDELQKEYFTLSPEPIMPSEVLQSLSWSERQNLFAWQQEDDKEQIEEWERAFEPEQGLRHVRAVAVFRSTSRAVVDSRPDDGDFPFAVHPVDVEQLALISTDEESIHHAWSASDTAGFGPVADDGEADPDEHEALFLSVCDGESDLLTETRMVDGELQEISQAGCERCPSTLHGNQPLRFELVATGSFSYPGAVEAIIHGRGCKHYPFDGVTAFLRRDLQGEWEVIDWLQDNAYSQCDFYETGRGISVPVCTEYNPGAEGSRPTTLVLDINTDHFSTIEFFFTASDRFRCQDSSRSVGLESIDVSSSDGRELLSATLKLTLSEYDNSGDGGAYNCDRELLSEETEILEPTLELNSGGYEWTQDGQRDFQRLQEVL